MFEQLDNLRAEFVAEARDLLDRAEECALRLEANHTTEGMMELFRHIHTVKGNTAILENAEIGRLAHELETELDDARHSEKPLSHAQIERVLTVVDRLRILLGESEKPQTEKPALEEARPLASEPILNDSLTARETGVSQKEVENPAPEKNRRLRIPAKFVERARSEGKTLSIVTLDLARDPRADLKSSLESFQSIWQDATVLGASIREDRLGSLEDGQSYSLPCSFLILTNGNPAAALQQSNWQPDHFQILYETETAPVQREVIRAEETVRAEETHLRVSVSLIDRLIQLAGETVGARNEFLLKLRKDPALLRASGRISSLITRLQEEIMRARLQPLRVFFQRLPRLVRDTAAATGKEVHLSVQGDSVELDKRLLDTIADPMVHLIRNAIDHGLESPEERVRAGKPRAGSLLVVAQLIGGSVAIRIEDDGRGLNYPAILKAATARGLVDAARAQTLSNEEIAQFIFHPGLSTKDKVTETSGRGIGMDVVRSSFENAGGSIVLTSVPGKGTSFTASLPQTLSIITCLVVRVADHRFAVPQMNIVELVRFHQSEVTHMSSASVYRLRSQLLPIVDLQKVLYDTPGENTRFLIVARSERGLYGIAVDSLDNPEEILVKPIGRQFQDTGLYAGAAVLADGSAVPILDTGGLARSVNLSNSGVESVAQIESRTADAAFSGLVFRYSGSDFALPLECFPRVEKKSRYAIEDSLGVQIVHHTVGAIPLLRLESCLPVRSGEGKFLVIFSEGGRHCAVLADEAVRVSQELPPVELTAESKAVLGRCTVDEKSIIVLSPRGLMERAA